MLSRGAVVARGRRGRIRRPRFTSLMKYPAAFTLFALGVLSPAAAGRAATLEAYFDFTKYVQAPAGSTITSNVHGGVPAKVKSAIASPGGAGLVIPPDLDAAETGVVLPAGALGALNGDSTLQIWYRTGEYIRPNTLLFGGSTSEVGDNSLEGDQALFVGYNNHGGRVQFIRPITNDGTRWGTNMADTPPGTGTEPDTLHDYVLVYDSGARRISAHLDGSLVGTMGAGDFAGLASLTGGLAIGGVQNSAFAEDKAAAAGIASFLIYRGTPTAGQVAQIHSFGSDVTKAELQSAGVSVTENSPTPGPDDEAAGNSRSEGAAVRRHRR